MNSLSISFSKAVELLKVSKDKVLEIEKYLNHNKKWHKVKYFMSFL